MAISEETRKKMSEAAKKRAARGILPDNKGKVPWNKGKPALPHVIEAVKKANIGRVHTDEEKAKHAAAKKASPQINIHRGGKLRPGSEGCQTIPFEQWPDFIHTVELGVMAIEEISWIHYKLVEYKPEIGVSIKSS